MVHEVLLDHVAFIAKAEHKTVVAVVCIVFHDVPQNRPSTNGNHWFWLEFCLFLQPGPLSSTEDNNWERLTVFHKLLEW